MPCYSFSKELERERSEQRGGATRGGWPGTATTRGRLGGTRGRCSSPSKSPSSSSALFYRLLFYKFSKGIETHSRRMTGAIASPMGSERASR